MQLHGKRQPASPCTRCGMRRASLEAFNTAIHMCALHAYLKHHLTALDLDEVTASPPMWLQMNLTLPMIKQGQADEGLPLQPSCTRRSCQRSARSSKGGLKANQELLCSRRMGKQSLVQRVPSWSPAQG